MNKYLKITFLSATLLIPVAIFLFLKFFGENRFDIPIYYQTGVPAHFENCLTQEQGQYTVSEVDIPLPATFLFLQTSDTFNYLDAGNIKSRLNDVVDGVHHQLYATDSSLMTKEDVKYLDSSQFVQQMRCNFVTDTANQFILVDTEKRIRGYYNADREEVDRLIVELKILLENERSSE